VFLISYLTFELWHLAFDISSSASNLKPLSPFPDRKTAGLRHCRTNLLYHRNTARPQYPNMQKVQKRVRKIVRIVAERALMAGPPFPLFISIYPRACCFIFGNFLGHWYAICSPK
jgi:hypothetical protein